jgi:hypothetical protein
MQWIREHCRTSGNSQLCKTCATPVELVFVFFSIHDARFTDMCAGAGAVMRLAVPFCPKCEARPEEFSCLHDYPTVTNPTNAMLN